LTFISKRAQSRQLVQASFGFDLHMFKSFYDFDTWQKVEPPPGTIYNYPLRDDEVGTVAGAPARPDVAAQIYTQALQTVMVSRVAQEGRSFDEAIKWARQELEGYLRT
jgi:hypothetical protein